jgi:hypothetical protein
VSQPHLSNIESGRRHASPAVARRLADALAVPLVALVAASDPSAEMASRGFDASPRSRGASHPTDPDDSTRPSRRDQRDQRDRDDGDGPDQPSPPSSPPRAKGAAMPEPILEPHFAPGVQDPSPPRRPVPVGQRRAVAGAVALASLGTVLASPLPAQAAASTFYTGSCSVMQSSIPDNAVYFRQFQARIVGVIETSTGRWAWDHYDYRYTVDPHLTFGPHSNESVSFQHGYKSGLSNPWASPDSHGTSGGWIGEPGWKGIRSNHNGTVVDFYAAFDIPGTPDPHCDGVTATV